MHSLILTGKRQAQLPMPKPPIPLIPIAKGLITKGLITKGPISKGPIAKGLITKGPIAKGPIAKPSIAQQQGAVLIIALVMLLILTLLAVSVMESSLVEERMAGNNLDRNIAFQVAEAALRAGEARVASFGNRPQPINGVASGSVSGLDAIPPASPNWWAGKDDAWWTTNGTEYDQDFAGTNEHPRYIIEEYDEVCDGAVDPTIRQCKIVYRVTAIAWGGRNTTVLLQSLFARRY